MRKVWVALCVVLMASFFVFPAKRVNGRIVLEEEDFTAQGAGWRYKQLDSMLTELANILGSTRNADVLDVNRINTDTIRGAPNVDSLAGNMRFTGKPTFADTITTSSKIAGSPTFTGKPVFADSVTFNTKVKIGGGAIIDSIGFMDDTADTLVVKVGGKKLKIAADVGG